MSSRMTDATQEFRDFHQSEATSLRLMLERGVPEDAESRLREILAWHDEMIAMVDAGTVRAERNDG